MRVLASIVAVASCCTLGIAFASEKTESTKTASATEAAPTCGQMMAKVSALPMKMSELMDAIGTNLDNHAAWMTQNADKASKQEKDALVKLAKQHHDWAASYKKTANEMLTMKDMPGAPHDPSKMDSTKMAEAALKQAKLEREMGEMMIAHAAEIEKMHSRPAATN